MKLAVIQLVKPEFPGNNELSSDVIIASGMHQTTGKIINARIAQKGPPVATLGSDPKGPPLTQKKIIATRPQNETGFILPTGEGFLTSSLEDCG